jgi:iron complex outermembrane receptor protein
VLIAFDGQRNLLRTGLALFDLTGAPLPGTAAFFANNPETAEACGNNLLCLFNAVNGAIDPTNPITNPGDQGTNPGDEPVRFNGVPIVFNIFREVDTTDEAFTWTAKLNYEPNDDTLIYLSAARGWKSGGFNLGFFSTTTPIFEEEEVTAFELGYKTQMLDGTLQLNTSIYGYLYDDIQTSITQTGGLGTGTNIVNAPEARTIGWEGDVMWLATERITLGGNWSYTNAEFSKNFAVVDVTDPRTPSTLFGDDERTLLAGDSNQLSKIPEWKFTLLSQYTWPLGSYGQVDFFTTASWTDEWFIESPFERDFDRAPSFWRWDARANWKSVNRRWEVGAFINNITDKVGVRQIETAQIEENFRRDITPTDPRVYGLQLKFHLVGG